MSRHFALLVLVVAALTAALGELAPAQAHHQNPSIDSDRDGQSNYNDTCPYDPDPGCQAVADKDGDRYNANQDPCDNNRDNANCDADGDGEPNQYDPCPTVASGHFLGQDQQLERQDRSCPAAEPTPEPSQPPPPDPEPGGGDPEPVVPLAPSEVPSEVAANTVVPDLLNRAIPLPDAVALSSSRGLQSAGARAPGTVFVASNPQVAAVKVTVESEFRLRGGRRPGTAVPKLTLRNVGGYTIELRCTGPGCPFRRSVKLPTTRSSYSADSLFRRATLRNGAKLQIRVVRGELYGRWYRFHFGTKQQLTTGRKGRLVARVARRLPTVEARCLRPSSLTPVSCPVISGTRQTSGRHRAQSPPATAARRRGTATQRRVTHELNWGWSGVEHREYYSRSFVQSLRDTNAVAERDPVVCGAVRAVNKYGGTACGAVFSSYGQWFDSWVRYAASRNECLRFTAVPLSVRSWRSKGFWMWTGSAGWAKIRVSNYAGSRCQ